MPRNRKAAGPSSSRGGRRKKAPPASEPTEPTAVILPSSHPQESSPTPPPMKQDVPEEADPHSEGLQQPSSSAVPVFARKSKPPLVERRGGLRFQWLGTPNKVLNRVKTDEELLKERFGGGLAEGTEHADSSSSEEEEEEGWETLSEEDDDPASGDWEEQLVYLELDDVPSLQELFAVQPDDFMRFQKKRFHSKFSKLQEPRKEIYPSVELKFHEFSSSAPVLQIGERYFSCRWEEAVGEAMLFRRKRDGSASVPVMKKEGEEGERMGKSSEGLRNIVPDPEIPWDNVFGANHLASNDRYELVGMADKVLKTELLEADTKKISSAFAGREFLARPGTHKFKIPQGYTATDLLAGQYKPKRSYARKRKGKQDDEDDGDEKEFKPEMEVDRPSSSSRSSSQHLRQDNPEEHSKMDTDT